MRHARVTSRAAWIAVALLGGPSPLLGACGGSDTCEDHRSAVEACDRVFDEDPCATPVSRCDVACFARVSCDEYPSIDQNRYPPWLVRCLSLCAEKFRCHDDDHEILASWRCDGDKDCVDGSDEEDCDYHECADGQLVYADSACDGYFHCRDRSDEVDCLCEPNCR